MNSTTGSMMAIDAEVLTRVFLRLLNEEGFINNKTYLAAEAAIEKGEDNYVDKQ